MSKLINYSSSEDEILNLELQKKIKMETKNLTKMDVISTEYDKSLDKSYIGITGSTSSLNNNHKNDSKDNSRELREHKEKKHSKESSSHKSHKNKNRERIKADRTRDRKEKSNYERRSDDRNREYSSRDKHRNDERGRRSDYKDPNNRNRSERKHKGNEKNHQHRSHSPTSHRHDKSHKSDHSQKHAHRMTKSKDELKEQKKEKQEPSPNDLLTDKSLTTETSGKISSDCSQTNPNNSGSDFKDIKVAEIQLPSYYNPNVINPNKFAEQVQKRKLIWGNKKNEDNPTVVNKWAQIGTAFNDDGDGKTATKFMRLMGIKNNPKPEIKTDIQPNPENPTTDVKRREDMFSCMEKQYEVARQVTHTMRGVGLGFGSQK